MVSFSTSCIHGLQCRFLALNRHAASIAEVGKPSKNSFECANQ
jgi:hypothetical protein